jgi:hypothetical protein
LSYLLWRPDRPSSLYRHLLLGSGERGSLTPIILRAGNSQLRAEAGKVYYNKGYDIYLGFQGKHPIIELAKWRYKVVGKLAVHLRNLRVHISRSSPGDEIEHEYIIHIKLSPGGNGITAEGFWGVVNEDRARLVRGEDVFDLVRDLTHLPAHASTIEERRVQLGQRGEAVLDLFIASPIRFLYACWGPPVKWVVYGFNSSGDPLEMLAICDYDDPDQLLANTRYW